MRAASLSLRDFRRYEHAATPLGAGLTLVLGPNGAGKTNLIEAIYMACTGRSFRTSNEQETIRFGAPLARVELRVEDRGSEHQLAVAITRGSAVQKRLTVDGATVAGTFDRSQRPLVSVFSPDRLELVKGVPALRRAHLDQLVAALWPSRITTRRSYNQALAQRNACLGRIRAGQLGRGALSSWNAELATLGLRLAADRASAVAEIHDDFVDIAGHLGLSGAVDASYRTAASVTTTAEFVAALEERTGSDLERGFTGFGPHRDELKLSRDGRELRRYGSQGEQRLALLALLLAERETLAKAREDVPLLLLDDVLSELDYDRRRHLLKLVQRRGQTVITATERAQIPELECAPAVIRVMPGGSLTPGDDAETPSAARPLADGADHSVNADADLSAGEADP
jgi:DNA replication and repair protein RecF